MKAPVIRVVVVDDHTLHRDGSRQILDAYPDLRVIADASSGELAFKVINQLHPDVVLIHYRNSGWSTRYDRTYADERRCLRGACIGHETEEAEVTVGGRFSAKACEGFLRNGPAA